MCFLRRKKFKKTKQNKDGERRCLFHAESCQREGRAYAKRSGPELGIYFVQSGKKNVTVVDIDVGAVVIAGGMQPQ